MEVEATIFTVRKAPIWIDRSFRNAARAAQALPFGWLRSSRAAARRRVE